MMQTTRFATRRTPLASWQDVPGEPHPACLSSRATYDADGNRVSLSVGATNYAYTYQAGSNKLTTIAGPTAATYSLDASGNVTGTGGKTFGYDAQVSPRRADE